jgi:hypothetical protein
MEGKPANVSKAVDVASEVGRLDPLEDLVQRQESCQLLAGHIFGKVLEAHLDRIGALAEDLGVLRADHLSSSVRSGLASGLDSVSRLTVGCLVCRIGPRARPAA